MKVLWLGAALLLAVTGCARDGEQPDVAAAAATAATADRAVAAAALADAIAANPALADSILSSAGYTPDGFQKLMYEIAADSAMSASYTAARRR
ncbi:MAG TPA: hypothetical protein VF862_03830 [Gemmatimonadales bacterium]